jgi:hypothetical protein
LRPLCPGPAGIKVRPFFGAYWGQCLERGFETLIEEDAPDAILAIDYDTIFTTQNVQTLTRLMLLHPKPTRFARCSRPAGGIRR